MKTAAAFIALLTSLSGPLVGLALRGHGSKDEIQLSNSFSLMRVRSWTGSEYKQLMPDNVKDALTAVETRLRQVPGAYVELDACETANSGQYGTVAGLAQEYSKLIFPQLEVIASAVSYSASEVGVVQITCQEN